MEKRVQATREEQSPWMHLQLTLHQHHGEIIACEKDNTNHLHLYGFGDYWAAFEQSAFRLNQLFPTSEVSVIYVKGTPLPMAMASVSDAELETFKRKHIYRTINPDHIVFAVAPLRQHDYISWKRTTLSNLAY